MVVIATVMTAVIGVFHGSAAFGATDTATQDSMCISWTTEVCAIANGSSAIEMVAPASNTTNLYPLGAGLEGEIEQQNTTSCMQLDASGGYIVIMATCTGASYQEWIGVYNNTYAGVQYESKWDTSLCLTYNANGSDLKVGGCGNDWYQSFIGVDGGNP
jgi:hypothetical protein